MTFFYDSFSLHSQLIKKGFNSIISEEEFYLDIDENDIRLKEFFEIVKLNLSDHQFIFNTLQEIENEKNQDELYAMFLNG